MQLRKNAVRIKIAVEQQRIGVVVIQMGDGERLHSKIETVAVIHLVVDIIVVVIDPARLPALKIGVLRHGQRAGLVVGFIHIKHPVDVLDIGADPLQRIFPAHVGAQRFVFHIKHHRVYHNKVKIEMLIGKFAVGDPKIKQSGLHLAMKGEIAVFLHGYPLSGRKNGHNLCVTDDDHVQSENVQVIIEKTKGGIRFATSHL